ncbi:hypothetical protein BLNAU_3483 [Blattamonas nauphoetae]|uniref:Uncharacterized protein n=1 Tax=Blattamonas nauphoetae TaxID=2049346 RepID=A0ABQ9YDB3_9EUKA|nr:hypothetical protein BLNAU_3483 [Blattamonas nauphoetae]
MFCSLVTLVKAGYPFDNALQDKATRFLKNLVPSWFEKEQAEKLVIDLVASSAGSTPGFIASILTLVSSSHSTMVAAALSFLHEVTFRSSIEIQCRLVESDLITNVFATVQPHTLSISGNDEILDNLIWIIVDYITLTDPSYLSECGIIDTVDIFNHCEMILQKVVIPSSQFVTLLISNRYVLFGLLFDSFMSLLVTHIEISPSHRPTLEFVLASPILMAITSCLSFAEGEKCPWTILKNINRSLEKWKREVGEVVQSAKRIIQALISEGFEDTLEQIQMNNKIGSYGGHVVHYCRSISQLLGSNQP